MCSEYYSTNQNNDTDSLIPLTIQEGCQNPRKDRTQKGVGYPDRIPVSDDCTWENVDRNHYHPQDYTADTVFAHDRTLNPEDLNLWADPKDPHNASGAPDFLCYESPIQIDPRGRPLNPKGPTGLEGRGILGNWGANHAADPIVTRINEHGQLEILVIKRKDTGEWAIPGGMVNFEERITATLKRELGEETSALLDFSNAQCVYKGYVDDPRNTDNAWIETDAYHLHLPNSVKIDLHAGDDASSVCWMVVDESSLSTFYASHADMIRRAIVLWQKKENKIVLKNGKVESNQ